MHGSLHDLDTRLLNLFDHTLIEMVGCIGEFCAVVLGNERAGMHVCVIKEKWSE